jgi:hypothetical protein
LQSAIHLRVTTVRFLHPIPELTPAHIARSAS